ncbi:MAG TPA: hypothetical protein VK897_00480 [Anaerolineales bacterium]|nr:hypothetical protein [Anaerolineales bacterium]
MKKIIPVILTTLQMLFVASCSGWGIQPGPFNPPTPFLPPTNTPSIFTATPVVIVASATFTPAIPTPTPIQFITATTAPTLIPSDTPVIIPTDTSLPSQPSVSVEILGCNTSIDVTHGMGEVTNAFVVLRNTGLPELTNVQVTLNALDEGREHPDKTVDVTSLPSGFKVMLKLTVDSTYQAETPVQIEVRVDGGLFQRVGADSCKDIGLFAPNPGGLNTPAPNNP